MKQIVFLIVVIFLVLVIINVSFSLFTLWSKKDLMTQTQQKLTQEQQENKVLIQGLKQASAPAFVEEQARDRLFMGKPGDVTVFLPTASSSAVSGQSEAEKSNWLQWWNLFF